MLNAHGEMFRRSKGHRRRLVCTEHEAQLGIMGEDFLALVKGVVTVTSLPSAPALSRQPTGPN